MKNQWRITNRRKLVKEFNRINCTRGSSAYDRVLVDGAGLVFVHNNGVGTKRIWRSSDDDRVNDFISLFDDGDMVVEN